MMVGGRGACRLCCTRIHRIVSLPLHALATPGPDRTTDVGKGVSVAAARARATAGCARGR